MNLDLKLKYSSPTPVGWSLRTECWNPSCLQIRRCRWLSASCLMNVYLHSVQMWGIHRSEIGFHCLLIARFRSSSCSPCTHQKEWATYSHTGQFGSSSTSLVYGFQQERSSHHLWLSNRLPICSFIFPWSITSLISQMESFRNKQCRYFKLCVTLSNRMRFCTTPFIPCSRWVISLSSIPVSHSRVRIFERSGWWHSSSSCHL